MIDRHFNEKQVRSICHLLALVCYTTKDIPFAAALLLFITELGNYLVGPGKEAPRPSPAGLILWGVLMSLLRSQGLYMVVFGVLVLLFQYRENWRSRRFLVAEGVQIIILLITLLINSVFPAWFGLWKTDLKEALPVPIQQIAVVLKDNFESENPFLDSALTEEALSYFDGYDPEKLDPYSADNMKTPFNSAIVKQNPFRFASTWLRLVTADFGGALNAFFTLIGPYFDMRVSPYNELIILLNSGDPVDIEQTPLLPGLHDEIVSLIRKASNSEAGEWLPRLFDPAWTLYLTAFLICYACIYKNRLLRIILIYPTAYILTMMLGPVSLLRYSYVYLVEFPFLTGCLFAAPCKSTAKKRRLCNNNSASGSDSSPACGQPQ